MRLAAPIAIVSIGLILAACTTSPKPPASSELSPQESYRNATLIVSGVLEQTKGVRQHNEKPHFVERIRVAEVLKGQSPGEVIEVLVPEPAPRELPRQIGATGLWVITRTADGPFIAPAGRQLINWEIRRDIRNLLHGQELPWGPPVDGLQLAVVANVLPTPASGTYQGVHADAVQVQVYLRNNSDKPVKVNLNPAEASIAIQILRPAGQPVDTSKPAPKPAGSPVVELAAGQAMNLTDQLGLSQQFLLIPLAAGHQVSAIYTHDKPEKGSRSSRVWTGRVSSNVLLLE